MRYQVTVGTLWLGKSRHVRGDIVDLEPAEADKHGTRLQLLAEPPVQEEKPKRKRRTKAEMEAARELELEAPADEDS